MHTQPYAEKAANAGRGRGRISGRKRPVEVQFGRDLLRSRSGCGSGCITDQSYFWIANRVYQSWWLRFSRSLRALLVGQAESVASAHPSAPITTPSVITMS